MGFFKIIWLLLDAGADLGFQGTPKEYFVCVSCACLHRLVFVLFVLELLTCMLIYAQGNFVFDCECVCGEYVLLCACVLMCVCL